MGCAMKVVHQTNHAEVDVEPLMVEIVLLTASVCWLIVLCAGVDRLASRLLWPYLAWVLFAATVNAGVIRLNPLPLGTWGAFS